jgi:YkoY family integral membrane protein
MTLLESLHTLGWSSIPVVFTLAGLEIILSADNAVVLAVLARQLRPELQKRALFYGIAGAFILRFFAILGAVWIIKFWFLQIIGGGYLIWLAVQHLTDTSSHDPAVPQCARGNATGFWKVVIIIELTDLAFAVDSVLAAVGVTNNLFIIYAGAVIGLIAMRFAAVAVLKLLEIFPQLKIYAYVLVAWIGLKLMFQGAHLYLVLSKDLDWEDAVHLSMPEFWIVTVLIATTAFIHWLRVSRAK